MINNSKYSTNIKINIEHIPPRHDLTEFENKHQLNQELDFLDFQINDITQHNFKSEEDIELENQKKLVKNQEKYVASSYAIQRELYTIKDSFSTLLTKLSDLTDNKNLVTYHDQLSPVSHILDELSHDIQHYLASLEQLSDMDINTIEERLDIIFKIKNKYKTNTINDLISHLRDLKKKNQ